MPKNVIRSRPDRQIKRYRNRILSPQDVERLIQVLEQHVSESSLTTGDHVRSLRQRHSSNTVCPRCGSNLVERTVKNGSNAGSRFLGCETYPKCGFTKNI